jgi:cytidine deaminase
MSFSASSFIWFIKGVTRGASVTPDPKKIRKLLSRARLASGRAYAPYSGMRFGSALLCRNGQIFDGANIENISFGLTCCAERAAVFKAVSEGNRDFRAMAIFSPGKRGILPCGACRQVLYEFNPRIQIVTLGVKGSVEVHELSKLLPGFHETNNWMRAKIRGRKG